MTHTTLIIFIIHGIALYQGGLYFTKMLLFRLLFNKLESIEILVFESIHFITTCVQSPHPTNLTNNEISSWQESNTLK